MPRSSISILGSPVPDDYTPLMFRLRDFMTLEEQRTWQYENCNCPARTFVDGKEYHGVGTREENRKRGFEQLWAHWSDCPADEGNILKNLMLDSLGPVC